MPGGVADIGAAVGGPGLGIYVGPRPYYRNYGYGYGYRPYYGYDRYSYRYGPRRHRWY